MKHVLVVLVSFVVTYLLFAFIFASFDARDWGTYWRFVCVVVGGFASGALIAESRMK